MHVGGNQSFCAELGAPAAAARCGRAKLVLLESLSDIASYVEASMCSSIAKLQLTSFALCSLGVRLSNTFACLQK